MTASRVINQPHLVTEQTREQVLAVVRASGYVPNLYAAGLRTRRTRAIACMVPTIASGSAFLQALRAMTERFEHAGYQVTLYERGYDRSRDDQVLDAVLARRPDGIALTGAVGSASAGRRLRDSGIPVIETWELSDDPIDMAVGFSHHAVGQAIARFLHARGRRNVASIDSSEGRTSARHAAFASEAKRLGIAGVDLVRGTSLRMAPPSRLIYGRQALRRALETDPAIDAIYAATDMVALGVIMEAQVRGIAVPRDLAIVGFGDFDFAAETVPALTTIRIDNEQIGQRAARMLIDRIEAGPPNRAGTGRPRTSAGSDGRRKLSGARRPAGTLIDLGFSLIERETT